MSGPGPLRVLDLFAGAGGLSQAIREVAIEESILIQHVAINHWEEAVETHRRNHPFADQYHAKVEEIPPSKVFPNADTIDLLTAGPECTHFSSARGGKPINEQARTSPWHVLDWVEKLRPDQFLMENVPEIQSWSKVDEDGKSDRDGSLWDVWTNALHALGYSVDWKVLNAADYGDPTSRRRLFVIGRRNEQPVFPDPTHSENGSEPGTEEWRPAKEVIDWSDPGESIWSRDISHKRVHSPPKNTTMQRIAEGLRRYGDDTPSNFAEVLDDIGRDEIYAMREDPVSIDELPEALEDTNEPFLVEQPGPVSDIFPDPNTNAEGTMPPYLLPQHSGGRPQNVDTDPMPTIAARGAISMVSPRSIVLPRNGVARGLHSNPAYDPDERPLHTVTAKNTDGHLVSPYLVPFYGERPGQDPRTHAVDDPLPTVTATGSPPAVTEPYLVQYYGNSDVASINDPLPTVTTKDRFALVVPELYPWGLDIRFRMLKPRELARAMGFSDGYEFAGNKTDTTKQIGNAVPVNLGKALIRELIVDETPSLFSFAPEARPEAETSTEVSHLEKAKPMATDGGTSNAE